MSTSDLLGTAAELVEAGASMQEPEFYDAAMTGDGEPAMLPLEESPWLPIYKEIVGWVPSNRDVIDLGCGTGRFAELLMRSSFTSQYWGVDFSAAAIEEARSYVSSPRAHFEVHDLRLWHTTEDWASSTFVCMEVLEHLTDDLRVVEKIPHGARFCFSVPNYLSASHVRCFVSLLDVFARYGHLLDIRRWTKVDFGGGNLVHVCDSVRT